MNLSISHSNFLLHRHDYTQVLELIWNEKDDERRLTWLRDKHDELHSILLFEQGIAEFINLPSIETVTNVTLPLFKAAVFRILQDNECLPLELRGRLHVTLYNCYATKLNAHISILLAKNLLTIEKKNHQIIKKACEIKVYETAQQSKVVNLPPPSFYNQINEVNSKLVRSDFADKIILSHLMRN